MFQAMSRVYRIGQKKQVLVVYSVVGNSCEARIAGNFLQFKFFLHWFPNSKTNT